MQRDLTLWLLLGLSACLPTAPEDTGPVDTGASDSDSESAADSESAPDSDVSVESDASSDSDASPDSDASADSDSDDDASPDTDSDSDASPDTDSAPDSDSAGDTDSDPPARTTIFPGFCPSTPTAPGAYRGSLASNLNDISNVPCVGAAMGRDGAVRVEVPAGQTLSATFASVAGDAVLYVLDSCPVVGSCLVGADASGSAPESIVWTNTGATSNPVYLILDHDELAGSGAFTLDFSVD